MDRYTKILLSIITLCLLWVSLKDTAIISDAVASSGVVQVKIVDISSHRSLPVEAKGEITCKRR